MYVVGRVEMSDASVIPDTPPRGSRRAYFVCEKVR